MNWELTKADFWIEEFAAMSPLDCIALGRTDLSQLNIGIYRSTDGGLSWSTIIPDTVFDQDYTANKFYFVDSKNGWLYHSWERIYDGLWKTSDGGVTWSSFPYPNHWTVGISGMCFRDTAHAFLGTNQGYALVTTDGGTSWTQDSTLAGCSQFVFVDSVYGWATDSQSPRRTTDGGATWQPTPQSQAGILVPLSTDSCLAFSDQGVFSSVNGGTSWTQISGLSLENPVFVSPLSGWASNSESGYFRTTDGGHSWTRGDSYLFSEGFIRLRCIDFVNADSGWVVGSSSVNSVFEKNFVAASRDAGLTWEITNETISAEARAAQFVTPTTGWIVGVSGTILKTTDGGISWQSQSSGTTSILFSLCFVDTAKGWAAGHGPILRTTDGGSSWQSLDYGAPTQVDRIQFVDSLNGWACGETPEVGTYPLYIRTTDGGTSWSPMGQPPGFVIADLFFMNAQKGWCIAVDTVSADFRIMASQDSGRSWTEQFQNPGIYRSGTYPSRIQFSDSLTGIVTLGLGRIFVTKDGGSSWLDESNLTNRTIHSLDVQSGSYAWICGTGGMIMRRTLGPVLSVPRVQHRSDTGPGNLTRTSAFPNPSNASITISFELQRTAEVTIDLYDILGRQIKHIALGEQEGGVSFAKIGLQSLASGVYVYVVRAEGEAQLGRLSVTK